VVNFEYKQFYGVEDLRKIVRVLRGPGGCPWDREQTHESIRRDLLEETYELADAIDHKDAENLKEELGDVLLQVVFHTELEGEANGLTLDDVADGVCKKLIYRHPHVFGETKVSGTGEVLSNWEQLKRVEKEQTTYTDTLKSVAHALPALWRAEKVQKKAAKAGFFWPEPAGALNKLQEETRELAEAMAGRGDLEEELGDVLSAAVSLARQLGVDPEMALNHSTDKFIRRFETMEMLNGDRDLKERSAQEYLDLWEQAKERT